MCTLKETLKNFIEDKKHNAGMTLEELNEWFKKIAQVMLSGRFEIKSNNNNKDCVIVRPTTVEMYFHEERDRKRNPQENDEYYKDYIVYHKNEENANTERLNKNKDIEYYKPGVLNTHYSGIDITFESKKHRFRASALIRAFKVENDITSKVTGVQYKNGKKVKEYIDDRSTYVYDALFSQFDIFDDGFSVKWKDKKELIDITSITTDKRQNVFEYKIKNKDSNQLILEKQTKHDERQWSFSIKEGQGQQQ
jgi:hypothetical protein